MKLFTFILFLTIGCRLSAQDCFPDGTLIPDWFGEDDAPNLSHLPEFRLDSFSSIAGDSTVVQTEQIQNIIDLAHEKGGGVVVIPPGTYLSGSLFFKPGTHLRLEKGAVLKGSDDIGDFAIVPTRMEGQSLDYFAALVNADGVDGFTITGEGTIDGNGLRYWKSFWLRRRVNPACTNMDELRPRLVYVSNSKDVTLSGVRLVNSPFWTTHLYRCERVKLLDLYIFSPYEPVKAPSTDAIDIDVCSDMLVKRCYISVNDDGIALKGGKGPTADNDPNNGGNKNIIIEDCFYGFCHSALTCGSESLHNRNIILRRCQVSEATRLLWLKMRPDTPQNYEYILVEDIKGNVKNFIFIKPWTQFFDMKGETEVPRSRSAHVTMRRISLECDTFFNVIPSEQYTLSDFAFEDIELREVKEPAIHPEYVENFSLKHIWIGNEKIY